MYDSHIHSEYSMDSTSSMESMVRSAIDKNFKSICFTDHVDFESSLQKIDFVFRPQDYFRNINKVKYKYKKYIEILAGVEIGIQSHLFQRYGDFLENIPFDFVIMSIHGVGGKDLHLDDFTQGMDPIDGLRQYYNESLACVKGFDNFDVLGHIDCIDRYFEDYSLIPKFQDYEFLVEEILSVLIEKGKGIEINTSGLRYGLDYFHPKIEILKLYKKLGGEIITFGSDAHSPPHIGYEYRTGERLLKELGFKYIHIFKDRKKFPINIL